MKKQVLFSCFGTTDPMRGMHDGPAMHILRKYRPEVLYLFLSPEINKLDTSDDRIRKMLEHMKTHWGYEPEYHCVRNPIKDVSDMDELHDPICAAMDEVAARWPKAEILVNLTSGTPQMQAILNFLVLDARYHARGVQVKNFEKQAGTSTRSNAADYDVDAELELNEDDQPGARDRCVEPRLLVVRREKQQAQVRTLLERRDYAAITEMPECLSGDLMRLVEHLAAREQLQDAKARRIAGELTLPFELYPKAQDSAFDPEFEEVAEYYLTLKNMQCTGRYSDLVFRLNPFVVRVQCRMLDRYLGFPVEEILKPDKPGRVTLSVDRLGRKTPELLAAVNRQLSSPMKDGDMSLYVNDLILEQLPGVPAEDMKLLRSLNRLNGRRNEVAHQLRAAAEDDILRLSGCSSHELMHRLEQLLLHTYPACVRERFAVHRQCVNYILENM